MTDLRLRAPATATFSGTKLLQLERSGRYEDALSLFGDEWKDEGFVPDVSNAPIEEQAEAMLRFGSLIGFYGYKHAVQGAQDRSKDLVTRARESYLELGDTSRVAECETYIALSYWRSGEHREALVWVKEALSHDLPASDDARLYAEVTRSLILFSTGRHKENVANCLAIEPDIRKYGDAFLNGSLCTNVGLSYKNLSRMPEAMRYLSLARVFHQKSRHKPYLGTVYNNLAQLFRIDGRYEMARESADAAIKLYRQLKDRTREASTWDTKAHIYLAAKDLDSALAAADRSVKMLRGSEASGYLIESLATRSKILLFMDRFADAVLSLVEAVNIARVQNGEDAARTLIDEFEAALSERNSAPITAEAIDASELELILPPSIARFEDYKGVWITNDRLQSVGLPQGSLAIFVPDKPRKGELAAILDRDGHTVSCGLYDFDFGIICLEAPGEEPRLFDEDQVEVLGKIVGVGRQGTGAKGEIVVEALAA